MRSASASVLACLLLAGAALPVRAQTVRGTITDATLLAPVAGAFVTLTDESGRAVTGTLADELGRFLIRAPRAGTYGLHVARIGYETERAEPFELARNETRTVALALASRAIRLEALRAEGANRCRTGTELGARTAAVWEEVRKALQFSEWTARNSGRRFRTLLHTRRLTPDGLDLLEQQFSAQETGGLRAFAAKSLAELREYGYVREFADSILFYAPDADVLLSDDFAADHCFRLTETDRRVGLRFEPLRRRQQSDVQGTLWLDRETLALQEINFSYDHLPYAGHRAVGGRIEFATLPDGAPIVRAWYIRSPAWARHDDTIGVIEIVESGGRVIDAFRAAPPDAAPVTVVLHGIVYDSVAGRPMSGASVRLAGTTSSAVSDGDGRFVLVPPQPGTYVLEIEHPWTDDLPLTPEPVVARAVADTTIRVATPSLDTVRDRLCRMDALPRSRRDNPGLVWGVLRDTEGRPMVGEIVSVSWDARLVSGVRIRHRGGVSTRTGSTGSYVLCGIPAGAIGEISYGAGRGRRVAERFRLREPPLLRADLVIERGSQE